MTSECLESIIIDLINMRGKAPDGELLEKQIKELALKHKLATEVEKEMEEMSTVEVIYTEIPKVISAIMGEASNLNMSCEIDAVHNRLRINRTVCGVKAPIDITYSNTCRMWTVEAKLSYGQFTSTYNGEYGSKMLKDTVKSLLESLSERV